MNVWFGRTGIRWVARTSRALRWAVVVEWMAPKRVMEGFGSFGGGVVVFVFGEGGLEVRIWVWAVRTEEGEWIEGGVGRDLMLRMRERRRERI